ncbi:MAG: glucose-1-phosphate thymidylyltransferase RfbA [Rickettsiaceae bacterium]|nr:glucose-1-phosphate thymidylyltransferase RfbA [Rickettsiaceae bacterium]
MKGMILSGGLGTRLYPLTSATGKQLLPIYDKPMIYYPLANLMSAGMREILVISSREHMYLYEKMLGDGSRFGIKLTYKIQEKPIGIADSFIIAEDFIANSPICLILGDNIFVGDDFAGKISNAASSLNSGAIVFGRKVQDPERYGVVSFDQSGNVKQIVEKPKEYISNYAITGLYCCDATVVSKAKSLKPSARGELEITDIQNLYLQEGKLKVEILDEYTAWLDAGTFDSLMEASLYVQLSEKLLGKKIACLEEIAFRQGWINKEQIVSMFKNPNQNSYVKYISELIRK